MNATLSTDYDTRATNRIAGFDPTASTAVWYMRGNELSLATRVEPHTFVGAAHPQVTNQKSWVDGLSWYESEDDIGLFEPIPSVLERGYYGKRKPETRSAAPTTPRAHLTPPAACRKSGPEPLDSLLIYLAEMQKHTTRHAQGPLSTDAMSYVLSVVSNLTVRSAIRKDKWQDRLEELRTFEQGWDSYDAEAPSDQAIDNARAFMAFLRMTGREPATLNPSTVGGVGFTFREGKRSVYIEFRNTGNAHAAFMGAGKPRVEKVIQDPDGFRAVMHKAEMHLYEQDAAAARSDEARKPSRH